MSIVHPLLFTLLAGSLSACRFRFTSSPMVTYISMSRRRKSICGTEVTTIKCEVNMWSYSGLGGCNCHLQVGVGVDVRRDVGEGVDDGAGALLVFGLPLG